MRRTMYRPRRSWLSLAPWAAGALILIIGGAFGFHYITRDTNPVPQPIRAKLTFSPFTIPSDTKAFTTSDYKYNSVENNVMILSYLIHTPNGTTVTLSEYPQPPEFNEIAEYKDRFLTNVAQQYASVQSSNGTVYLGRLSRQKNKQLAVMTERGLLILMSPDKEMDQAQWHNLAEQLEIRKVSK